MKRFLAVLLAGVMTLGLCACGKTETVEVSDISDMTDLDQNHTQADTSSQSERTKLIVGFDAEFPPYGYMDENGEMIVTIGRNQADTSVVVGSTADFTGSGVWNDPRSHAWWENGTIDHKYLVFMYKVEELPCEGHPEITIDPNTYYVKFFVNCQQVQNESGTKYYVSVDGPHVANSVSEVNACKPVKVELTNHIVRTESETGEIQVTKRLVGKDSAENIKYQFKLFGQNSTMWIKRDLGATVTFFSSNGRT